jgi:hypothetical protein
MKPSKRLPLRWICLLAAGCVFSACTFPNPSPVANLSTPLQTNAVRPTTLRMTSPPTVQPVITLTNTDIQSTDTLPPPTSTVTSILPLPSHTPTDMTVKVFLIAVDDQGRSGVFVGCGDSAVPVTMHVPYTTGMLRAALTSLLGIHDQFYGESGLYNALYQSHLTVGNITINSGTATIHLDGTLTLGGECDSPRVEAQLKQTALQFSTVRSVSIFINDRPLEDLLSGR